MERQARRQEQDVLAPRDDFLAPSPIQHVRPQQRAQFQIQDELKRIAQGTKLACQRRGPRQARLRRQ